MVVYPEKDVQQMKNVITKGEGKQNNASACRWIASHKVTPRKIVGKNAGDA